QEPRPQRLAAPEPAERPVGLHEALLRSILRLGGGAGNDVRGAECELLVALHQPLVGDRVAAPRALDEVVLEGWPVLHRPYYTAAATGVPAGRAPALSTAAGRSIASIDRRSRARGRLRCAPRRRRR